MKYLKRLLICIYAYAAVYLLLALILHAVTGFEPTAECGVLAGIVATESIVASLIKREETKFEARLNKDAERENKQ